MASYLLQYPVRESEVSLKVCLHVIFASPFIAIVTARKRSLRRLCFYMCLSVHREGVCGRGVHVWVGGMCGEGHAWQGCVHSGGHAGGMSGEGGKCGRGHAWWGGHAWHTCPPQILRDTVNERAVRILLECILVIKCVLFIVIRIIQKMDWSPILSIIHTVTTGTMLNLNNGNKGRG